MDRIKFALLILLGGMAPAIAKLQLAVEARKAQRCGMTSDRLMHPAENDSVGIVARATFLGWLQATGAKESKRKAREFIASGGLVRYGQAKAA